MKGKSEGGSGEYGAVRTSTRGPCSRAVLTSAYEKETRRTDVDEVMTGLAGGFEATKDKRLTS